VAGSPYVLSAFLSPAGVLGNYAITYNTAAFTINPRPASRTPHFFPTRRSSDLPALTGTLSGFLAADNVTATYSRPAGETVAGSPYVISATLSPAGVLGNYAITYNTANFTISPRPASVTPNAASKTYGNGDPALTGTLSGFLAADGVTAPYRRAARAILAGSPYVISATLSPAGVLGNYDITYNTANFTITARPITVTADAKTKVYGNTDVALTYQITSGSLAFSDAFTGALTRAAGETVGTYAIQQGTLALSTNYVLTYVGANLTITKATLTVTADNKTRQYSDPNPTFTASYSGFKNGETLATSGVTGSPSLTTTATATSAPGPYTITAALGTLAAANYQFGFVNGTLTVTPE